MIKEVFDLFAPFENEAEERVYYYCYSPKSRYKIPGWDQDDLAQELIIKMNKAMASYDLSRSFVSFMNTVCKRRLIDIYRGTESSKDVYKKCEICPDNIDGDEKIAEFDDYQYLQDNIYGGDDDLLL